MKISQHNWSWWFMMSLIVLIISLLTITTLSFRENNHEYYIGNIICIIAFISFICCLYVGTILKKIKLHIHYDYVIIHLKNLIKLKVES